MRVLVSETIRAAATYAILRTVMNIEAQRSCPVA
jgi:phosphohistidine phosphatase SixA